MNDPERASSGFAQQAGSRIGDAERSVAINRLSDHVAGGKLSAEEFNERVELALSARTHGELEPLFNDLDPPMVARAAARGPVVSLTAGDLSRAVGFAVGSAPVAWLIGSYIGGDYLPATIGLWLLMLVCAAVGAALRRPSHD